MANASNVQEALRNLEALIAAGAGPELTEVGRDRLSATTSVDEFAELARQFGYHPSVVVGAVKGRTSSDDAALLSAIAAGAISDLPEDPFAQLSDDEFRRVTAEAEDARRVRLGELNQQEQGLAAGDASELERMGTERAFKERQIQIANNSPRFYYDPEDDTFWMDRTGQGLGAIQLDVRIGGTDLEKVLAEEEAPVAVKNEDGSDVIKDQDFLSFITVPDGPSDDPGVFLPSIIGGFPERFVTVTAPDGSQVSVRQEGSFLAPEAPIGSFFQGQFIQQQALSGSPDFAKFVEDNRLEQTATALYRDGEQFSLFAVLSPESKASLQEDMVAAGLMGEGTYSNGVWDLQSARAAENLLAMSNGNGVTWDQMLRLLKRNPTGGAGSAGSGVTTRPFVTPTYLAPDYAELAQSVKRQFRRDLRRDPSDAEVALLAEELGRQHRAAFDVQVQAARQDHDAGNRALTTQAEQRGGPDLTGVNEVARFEERFEELFGPEIDRNQRISETRDNFSLLMQSITGGDRLVR